MSASHHPSHVLQRRNLVQWVQSEQQHYSFLRYHPWTTPGGATNGLLLQQSMLQPLRSLDILGVVTTRPLEAGAVVCGYPGVLMTEEMHERFAALYHCPTAMWIPELDYSVDLQTARGLGIAVSEQRDSFKVRMVLVGDPTAFGPLLNSPMGVKEHDQRPVAASVEYRSTRKSESTFGSFIPFAEVNGVRKIQVSGDLVYIRATSFVAAHSELFAVYEHAGGRSLVRGGEFWLLLKPFCVACQRVATAASLTRCCSPSCKTTVHLSCIRGAESDAPWMCSIHLRQHLLTATSPPSCKLPRPTFARPATPPATSTVPAAASTSALHRAFLELQCTPPPAPRHSVPFTARPSGSVSRALSFEVQPASAPARSVPSHAVPLGIVRPRQLASTLSQLPAASDDEFEVRTAVIDAPAESSSSSSDSSSDFAVSDSESDDSLVDGIAASMPRVLGRRSIAVAPVESVPHSVASSGRRVSFPQPPKPPVPPAQLSEANKNTMRTLWSQHARKHNNVRWLKQLATDETVQAKRFAELTSSLQQLQTHCGSFNSLMSQGLPFENIRCAQNVMGLLEYRMAHLDLMHFDKKSLKQQLLLQYQSLSPSDFLLERPWQPFHSCRLRVCARCLCACLGISESNLRRAFRLQPSDSSRRVNKESLEKRVSQLIKQWAVEYGQSVPTAEGKVYTIDRTINSATHKEARQQLQKYLRSELRYEFTVSESMWRRCLNGMAADQSCMLRCTKAKGMAKCSDCDNWNMRIAEAMQKREHEKRVELEKKKNHHLDQAREQRALFESWKVQALAVPWRTWVITLDGMDTNKTNLPHLRQNIKCLELRSGVRVVGCVGFGSPLVIQGTTTLSDVQAKGAAASITQLECFLNNNWLALDLKSVRPLKATDGHDELPEEAAAELSSRFQQAKMEFQPADGTTTDGVPLPHASAASGAASAASAAGSAAAGGRPAGFPRAKRTPFYWPEHLHLTFDNTAADCKNSRMLNFLGMLVALGVFAYITINTLLVGHTHDIVDQVFSHWASALNTTDALTLSLLHALFRQRYASQIYALEKAMKGNSSSSRKESKRASVHAMLHELAVDLGMEPVLLRQTFCMEPMPILDREVKNTHDIHVFLIQRDLDEDTSTSPPVKRPAVLLKCRYEAKIDVSADRVMFTHDGPGGRYTSCKRLFWVDEVKAMCNDDVYRSPSMRFPSESMRTGLKDHWQEKMKGTPADEWEALFKHVDAVYKSDIESCPTADPEMGTLCSRLRHDRQEIGKLHRPSAAAEPKELAEYNEKNNRKTKLISDLRKHILSVHHPHLVVTNWLKKWVERVELFIGPYYRARGIATNFVSSEAAIANMQLPDARKSHPRKMPHDAHRGPIFKRNVFDEALESNGGRQPKLGDIVVTRGRPWFPIYIGVVVDPMRVVLPPGRANKRKAPADKRKSAAPPAPAKRGRGGGRGGRGGRRGGRGGGTQAAAASSSDDESMPDADGSATPAAAAASTTAGVTRRKQARRDYGGQDEECPTAAADPDFSEDSESDAESGNDQPCAQRRDNGAQPAAAAESAEAQRIQRIEKKVAQLTHGRKDSICVRWYTFIVKNIDGKKIDDQAAVRATITVKEEVELWDQACVAAEAECGFQRLPHVAVGRWKSTQWKVTAGYTEDTDWGFISVQSIITFGSHTKMFTKATRLTDAQWKLIVADLCEVGEQGVNALKAAQEMDEDERKDEHKQ